MKFRISRAYTLAEVVIVMLIIAVVVAISIRAAKAKMDNIITYNYYAAYETMRNVTRELLLDYDAEDEIYQAKYSNFTIAENKGVWSNLKTLWMNPAWASEEQDAADCERDGRGIWNWTWSVCGTTDEQERYSCDRDGDTWDHGICIVKCPEGYHNKTYNSCEPNSTSSSGDNTNTGGNTGSNYNQDAAECSTLGGTWVNGVCYHDSQEPTGGGKKPEPPTTNNTCIKGQHWDESAQKCVPDNTGDGSDDGTGSSGDGTGGTGDGTGGTGDGTGDGTGSSGDGTDPDSGDGNTCDEGFHWNAEENACVQDGRTVPKKDLCPNFESKVNTKSLVSSDSITEFCKGDSISDSDTDFSEKDPDLILRNGMRLYNLSQPYVEIEALKDGAAGAIFIDADGNEIDTNKNGYIVYADIDGLKGESKLWVDVFPFYITLSGQVIPAYPADGSAGGGNDKFYLSTSLSYEKIEGNQRKTNWLTKSVSFQESACKSGYIDEGANYCNGFTKETACKEENIDCRIKYIKPSPLFK